MTFNDTNVPGVKSISARYQDCTFALCLRLGVGNGTRLPTSRASTTLAPTTLEARSTDGTRAKLVQTPVTLKEHSRSVAMAPLLRQPRARKRAPFRPSAAGGCSCLPHVAPGPCRILVQLEVRRSPENCSDIPLSREIRVARPGSQTVTVTEALSKPHSVAKCAQA